MKIAGVIAERAAEAGLPFIVIGGNAVIAHGYARQTVDVDFLVKDTDRRKWDELIISLGYRQHHIQRVFHMYNPIPEGMPAKTRAGISLPDAKRAEDFPQHILVIHSPEDIPHRAE